MELGILSRDKCRSPIISLSRFSILLPFLSRPAIGNVGKGKRRFMGRNRSRPTPDYQSSTAPHPLFDQVVSHTVIHTELGAHLHHIIPSSSKARVLCVV